MNAYPEQETISENDLSYIRLKFTDENGELQPMARSLIRVEVQGGTLLALGNGCPFYSGSYLTDITDTYYGEALAIIQPNNKAAQLVCSGYSEMGNCRVKVQVIQ